MTFEDALRIARDSHANTGMGTAGVTIITNQAGGVASFATGLLHYFPTAGTGKMQAAESLRTPDGQPLDYLFSDRTVAIPQTDADGTPVGSALMQPFAVTSADKLAFRITPAGPALLFLVSHGNMEIIVPVEDRAGVLVGVGGGIGGHDAVYVISFHRGRPYIG